MRLSYRQCPLIHLKSPGTRANSASVAPRALTNRQWRTKQCSRCHRLLHLHLRHPRPARNTDSPRPSSHRAARVRWVVTRTRGTFRPICRLHISSRESTLLCKEGSCSLRMVNCTSFDSTTLQRLYNVMTTLRREGEYPAGFSRRSALRTPPLC